MRTVFTVSPPLLTLHLVLLIVHRGFFARALEERPDDPVASAFGASVLACFRAAMYMTTAVRTLHARVPFCVRFSYIWSAAFSACVSEPPVAPMLTALD